MLNHRAPAQVATLLLAFLPSLSAAQAQQVRPDAHRTPDERFQSLEGYAFEPHYLEVDGLRMHFVDEGEAELGTFLLLHGEPVWSYMYRGVIPGLVAAGYRVVAPDNIGFGRSDKVTKKEWYSLDRHVATLKALIERLDLRRVTVVVNDWGGPNGLVLATEMPERFARLVILNTWLHHEGYEYSRALRTWNQRSPNVDFTRIGAGPRFNMAIQAPFDTKEATAGAYAWPWMLPFAEPEAGGAERQAAAWEALADWDKPAHVIFGELDPVFTADWGRQFAAHIPGATINIIEGERHRPLLDQAATGTYRASELVDLVLRLIAEESQAPRD